MSQEHQDFQDSHFVNNEWDGVSERRTKIRVEEKPTHPHDGSGHERFITRDEFEKRLASQKHAVVEIINTRFTVFEDKVLERLDKIDSTLKSGFVNGNPDEHRRDHELRIKIDNERRELYKVIREKIISSSVWGMLVLIALASWEYIKMKAHTP